MTDRSTLIEEFRRAVSSASYHHADDSTREWGQARVHENRAKEIFAGADDELKAELREIARGNLIGDWWRA